MHKPFLSVIFCIYAIIGYSQHSFTIDLHKGVVFIVKKNAKQPTIINNSDNIFPGDKLVLANNSSWAILTNEKGEQFHLQRKGEYTINSLNAQIASLKDSPIEKYWTFIKKYFLPETNKSGGIGLGGGIDMQDNSLILFPPDSAVYLKGEKIKLKIKEINKLTKIRIIIADPSYRFILDTVMLLVNPLDISELVRLKQLVNFNIVVSYDFTGDFTTKDLKFHNFHIDQNNQPECLLKLYRDYPKLSNNESDMALIVKAGILHSTKYFSAAERLRKKVFK